MLKTACLYHKMQDFAIFDSKPNALCVSTYFLCEIIRYRYVLRQCAAV